LIVKTSCPIGKLTDTATVTSTTLNPNPTPQNSGSVNFVVVNPGTTTPQVCTD
jgi:hypothetical protein